MWLEKEKRMVKNYLCQTFLMSENLVIYAHITQMCLIVQENYIYIFTEGSSLESVMLPSNIMHPA
jgi:hypothetical protein